MKKLLGVCDMKGKDGMKRVLYAIVHEGSVHSNINEHPKKDHIVKELDRIKREEDWINIYNYEWIPPSIPRDAKILVCGAYYGGLYDRRGSRVMCVDGFLIRLQHAHYDAELYEPATLPSNWCYEHPNGFHKDRFKEDNMHSQ